MQTLIQSATIIQPGNTYHNQQVDLLITDGVIERIDTSIEAPQGAKIIHLENLHISEGWFDSSVNFGEPGFEERETIANGIKTAAKSGFTAVALNANGYPTTDNKSVVNFIKNTAANEAVSVHPIGNLTKKGEGKDIAELYDMQQGGAIAFGDYKKEIENPNLLKVALQYCQGFDGLVMSYPNTQTISGNGVANEGIHATQLGIKGAPSLAEELQISRDLFILEYTGGRLHIPTVSTAKSVALIAEAKAKGLQVTCSVSADHLTLTDKEVQSFDSNFKITPPLRTQNDVDALLEGVKNGTIDVITADHCPIDIENKKLEFSQAEDGSIGLESLYTSLQTVLDTESIVNALTQNSKPIFGLDASEIKEGEKANLTLFTPKGDGVFKADQIYSTSKNSAYLGKKTQGKVYGTIVNTSINLNT